MAQIMTWDEFKAMDTLRKKQYLTLLQTKYQPTRHKLAAMLGTTKGKLDVELRRIDWGSGNQRGGVKRKQNDAIVQIVNEPPKKIPFYTNRSCHACGAILVDGARYCHLCGTIVKTDTELFIDEIEAAIDDLVTLKRPDKAIKALNKAIEWVERHAEKT